MRTFIIFAFIIGLLFPFKIFALETNLFMSVTPSALTALTNKERVKNNLAPLLYNDLLQKAAQMKADDMAERGYFSHTTPEGLAPWYFFNEVGYQYRHAGENLAVNFFNSAEVAEAWMNSPTHRANVMKKDFTQIGIGIANGVFEGKSTVFVTEFFGTPLLQTQIASPVITERPKAVPATIATPIAKKILGETITEDTVQKDINDTITPQSEVNPPLQRMSFSQYITYLLGGVVVVILLILLKSFIRK